MQHGNNETVQALKESVQRVEELEDKVTNLGQEILDLDEAVCRRNEELEFKNAELISKEIELVELRQSYRLLVEETCLDKLQQVLDKSKCLLESLPDGRFKVTYQS